MQKLDVLYKCFNEEVEFSLPTYGANFYKDQEYYSESIKYYSLALKKIEKDHFLVPKILDRRGTSFERLGDWENAEKDLLESLKIKPNDAHVMNYLAYSWIDKGINLDEGLEIFSEICRLLIFRIFAAVEAAKKFERLCFPANAILLRSKIWESPSICLLYTSDAADE